MFCMLRDGEWICGSFILRISMQQFRPAASPAFPVFYPVNLLRSPHLDCGTDFVPKEVFSQHVGLAQPTASLKPSMGLIANVKARRPSDSILVVSLLQGVF